MEVVSGTTVVVEVAWQSLLCLPYMPEQISTEDEVVETGGYLGGVGGGLGLSQLKWTLWTLILQSLGVFLDFLNFMRRAPPHCVFLMMLPDFLQLWV